MTNNRLPSQTKSCVDDVSINPFKNNSFVVFITLMSKYGVDNFYLWKASLILFLSFLELPFSLYEDFVYGPQIKVAQIKEDPIFIIGHWRSGTTHLHNILSQDTQWGTPTHMHVFYPKTFFTFKSFRTFFAHLLPADRRYDEVKVGLDVPEEEEEALVSYSFFSCYHAIIFPKFSGEIFRRCALLKDLNQDELTEWQRDYLWFLKKLSLVYSNRPLMLKNPVNTCRIEALTQLFPQARFVHIHRNPFQLFESNIKMLQIYRKEFRLQKMISVEELKRGILQRYQQMMEAYDCQSKSLSSNKLVEVSFEQLREHPLETVQQIYTGLNLPGFNDASSKFEQYIDSQRNYKQNIYSFAAEDLQSVQESCGKWIDRWGYCTPNITE